MAKKCTRITVRGKKSITRLKKRLREEGTKFSVRRHGGYYRVYPKCK